MKKSLKILLINAINTSVETETRYPHLGFGYLIAYSRRSLPDLKLDFKIEETGNIDVCEGFTPDIVGVSSVSQNFEIARRFSDYFGNQNIPVIIGGTHITSIPESLPESALAACMGEGELTFAEILKFCAEEKLTTNLSKINGIAYRDGSKVVQTKPRKRIGCLDDLPQPDRSHMTIGSHAHMFTSRGCPYRCVFCSSSRFWQDLRFFSAEYVAAEIEVLFRKYKVKMISFFDDLFVADVQRIQKLIKILAEMNILGKIKFTTNCRANLVDEKLAELLACLNVVSVGLGLESGNEESLRFLKTGNVTVQQNDNAINILKSKGIFVNASFIIGAPEETEMQIIDTYRFIKKSQLDLFDVYFLTPLPGTPIWDLALENKLVSNDIKDWSRLDVNAYRNYDKVIFVSNKVSPDRLIKIYKQFRKLRFFRNMTKAWRHPLFHLVPKVIFMMIYDSFMRALSR